MVIDFVPAPPDREGRQDGRRIKRPVAISTLLGVACLVLSNILAVSSTSFRPGRIHDRSLVSSAQSMGESGAFIFSLLKRRRKNGDGVSQSKRQEPAALVVDKATDGNGYNLIQTPNTNGDDGHHIKYYLGENNGYSRLGQNQLLDNDVVEDEPYDTMHPIENAYNKLSRSPVGEELPENSLDSLEGNGDNVNYTLEVGKMGKEIEESFSMNNEETVIKGGDDDDGESSRWAKRNARSIDEGIRFKSQLREGLEEQTKLHRERLLSNLLEGVIGGTTSALEIETEKIKNATNPFRWLGFGRGNKDSEAEGVRQEESAEADVSGSTSPVPDAYEEADANFDSNAVAPDENEADTKEKSKSGKFGARIITGLIMALAEEVEGLDVEVDTDSDTPIGDKTIHSIKIYFSRLGFRQLRMGGLNEAFSELESSMGISEKFALAKSFFNVGKPTTADEAFDKMDVDKSGTLDEEELAQALKMAALIGGNKFGARSKETLTELASRLVRLYDADGNGVVDREEYQAMVQDMAALKDARLREEMHEQPEPDGMETNGGERKRGWFSSAFRRKKEDVLSSENATMASLDEVVDVTDSEEFWGSIDQGEGSIVLEDLKLDLRRLIFGAIPGAKRILPGGPLILKPFTATVTASFTREDIMNSVLLDIGLRRLVARALSRRVRGIRDLLDGAVFYGRTWKQFEQNSPQVEVAKLEDVQFDKRNRLIITGRAKITEALGYSHKPIEQGFKVRTKIGTRENGRIIGLLQPEIAIFAECPKDLEKVVRTQCKEWFGYTIPNFKPLYTFIPLVSPLKKNDKMDGFNMGEDNQIKSIDIKNGKLEFSFCAFLRPGRFLGNHYLAFTVPNRTLILTLDRVREGMRNARRNKRLAELAAREVQQLAAAGKETGGDNGMATQSNSGKPYISPEGKVRIRRLEEELKAKIQEDLILREMEESTNEEKGKSFVSRFVEGYSGAIREELNLEMNARLSSSISDFFGSQDREGEDKGP